MYVLGDNYDYLRRGEARRGGGGAYTLPPLEYIPDYNKAFIQVQTTKV